MIELLRTSSSYRRAVGWVALLLVAAALPGLLRLELDHSPRSLLEGPGRHPSDSGGGAPAVETWRLVLSGSGLASDEGLEFLEELEARLLALEPVLRVVSPASRHRTALLEERNRAGFWKELAARGSLDRQLGLVSPDGAMLSILIETQWLEEVEAAAFLRGLEELAASAPAGIAAEPIGERSLDLAFRSSSLRIWQRVLPFLALVTVLLLGWTFGSWASTLAPLAFVATSLLLLLGPLGYSGIRVHLLLAIAPPFLYATGLATALHLGLETRQRLREGLSRLEAVAAALRHRQRALLATHATTILGWLALLSSPARPVRELALTSAAGVALQLGLAWTLLPVLLASPRLFPAPSGPSRAELMLGELAARAFHWGAHATRGIVAASGLALLVALAGWIRLHVESNALEYLRPEHPVRERLERLERQGLPIWRGELELESAPEGGFREPSALATLARLWRKLAGSPPAIGGMAATSLLEDLLEREFGETLPAGPAAYEAALVAVELEQPGALEPFLDSRGRWARLVLFFESVGFENLESWKLRARELVQEHFPGARLSIGGLFPQLLDLQKQILSTLLRSSFLSLLPVASVLLLVIRPLGRALAALAVNLWPLLSLLGLLGWAGGSLDVGTVLVGAVLLGLVVDATLHLLTSSDLAPEPRGAESLLSAPATRIAPALLVGTGILALGFVGTALSDFLPLARFGLLMAGGLLLALAADLLLLPALLALARPRSSRGNPGAARPG